MISSRLISTLLVGLLSALLVNSQAINSTFQEYKLVAKSTRGCSHFDGLFVEYYHTCAGCNDVVLTKSTNAIGYLDGDVQYFDYDGQNLSYQFGFIPTDEGVEQGYWQKVTIDPFHGATHSAKIVDGKLIYEKVGNFQWWFGWIVCDWYHVEPQLFHLTQKLGTHTYNGGPILEIPKFCEVIDLLVQYT